jgi:hypothetical protein
MKIKIHNSHTGICGVCRNSAIAEGRNGEFLVECDRFGTIPGAIVTCSRFDDRRLTSLNEMRRTAWILQTDEQHKTIGFVSNKQWRKSRSFTEEGLYFDEDD